MLHRDFRFQGRLLQKLVSMKYQKHIPALFMDITGHQHLLVFPKYLENIISEVAEHFSV